MLFVISEVMGQLINGPAEMNASEARTSDASAVISMPEPRLAGQNTSPVPESIRLPSNYESIPSDTTAETRGSFLRLCLTSSLLAKVVFLVSK